MKVAHVYDWLTTMGGGERALSALVEVLPAPVYTLVHDAQKIASEVVYGQPIHTSFLQKYPFAKKYYRYYLPLFPFAIEQFDLREYDVVLSTSHAVAKGVLTHAEQLHLCYCFTPMRYAWDLTQTYLSTVLGPQKGIAKWVLHYLRHWDIASVSRVDEFVAISHYIARRIAKTYGRKAEVIYPPVDTHLIPFQEKKDSFYLTVSRMVPYKRIDLIVEAFSHLPHEKLVVIGDGPERERIHAKAGKNVEFLGRQPDTVVHDYLKNAKGFIFAAEEDFGIVVVEAQAAGTPVLAFGRGGALETVKKGHTGLFFNAQTVPSLLEGLHRFAAHEFCPQEIRKCAERFNKTRFQQEWKALIETKWTEHHESHHSRRG